VPRKKKKRREGEKGEKKKGKKREKKKGHKQVELAKGPPARHSPWYTSLCNSVRRSTPYSKKGGRKKEKKRGEKKRGKEKREEEIE